jgi:outer membrane protein TolC
MYKFPACTLAACLLSALPAGAEVRTMTMREAVDQALRQNPDVLIAHLNEERAKEGVRVAKDPFVPRVAVGCGLAYSSGFPMSIEGSAPSIFQATATQFLFNRPQSYTVAQAKETARGAGFGTAARKNDVAYRTASLYLDAERAGRLAATARKELDSLQKVMQTVESQVAEGRVLPIERTRAALALAQARLTVQNIEADQITAETALAALLGFGVEDRVQASQEQRPVSPVPPEEAAVESALQSNKELRQIESQIVAKELEIRATKAQRLPRVDLVAQYSMLARYNNYEEFFRKYQRNNGQLGMSFQIPILPGPGVSASVAQSQADITRLRTELRSMRNKIVSDTRQSYRELRRAQTAQEVAKLDLDLAREQLSVLLAQMQEGRAALRQVEEARVAETNKWIAFYDAQYVLERARILVLHNAGELAASLR